MLREIAAARLERRGMSLDSGTPEVREALGESLWEVTDPDREPPRRPARPGPGLEELERTIARLERL